MGQGEAAGGSGVTGLRRLHGQEASRSSIKQDRARTTSQAGRCPSRNQGRTWPTTAVRPSFRVPASC